MNPVSEYVGTIVDRCDQQAGIVLVGSRTLSAVRPDDWDFVVVSKRDEIWNIFLGNTPERTGISTDSIRFAYQGQEIGLVPLATASFAQRISGPLDRHELELSYQQWAIGAVAPEGFLGDIAHCKVVRDTPEQIITSTKARLNPYPFGLRDAIEKVCTEELLTRFAQLQKALDREDIITTHCLSGHVVFLLLRLLTAHEGHYFAGTKHNKQIQFTRYAKQKQELDTLAGMPVDTHWLKLAQAMLTNIGPHHAS